MLKNIILVHYLLISNLLFGQNFVKSNLKQDFNRVGDSDSLRENYAIVYGKFKSKKNSKQAILKIIQTIDLLILLA